MSYSRPREMYKTWRAPVRAPPAAPAVDLAFLGVTYIFHGTKTQNTDRTAPTLHTTVWRSPPFTS